MPAEPRSLWVAGLIVATVVLVVGAGSRLVRVSAGLREASAPPRPLVVAPNDIHTGPDTVRGRARLARGESDLRAGARQRITPANPPTFVSGGVAPIDIRRSAPIDPQHGDPEPHGAPADAPAPPTLEAATSHVSAARWRPIWQQPVLVGSLGVILTGFADQQVRLDVQEEVQEDDGGEPRAAGSSISRWSTPVALGIGAGLLGVGLATHHPGLARTGRDALAALGVASLLATTANIAVGRAQPEANRGTDYFAPFQAPSRNNSFPSGQTSRAFALAAVVAAHTRHRVFRVTAYGAAAVVGIAELVADRHFSSDVVGGAVLGTLVGRGVVRHFAAASPPLALAVTTLPGRVGIALNRSF